jgi:transcriptional pleiotropic regulator of transition state genes
MKDTGIVRKLDDMGRITLPKELRRTLDLNPDDPVEIYVEGNEIILQKFEKKRCTFCHGTENLSELKEKYVCEKCREELSK